MQILVPNYSIWDPNPWALTQLVITGGGAAILPSLKEPPQLQFKAGLPFLRGLVLDRLNLLPSRPFLPPPPPLPLKEPMMDRGRVPPRNSSRYLSISEEDEGKKCTSLSFPPASVSSLFCVNEHVNERLHTHRVEAEGNPGEQLCWPRC